LIQELVRVRDVALPTFLGWENEIYETYELANELITSLWSIDKLIDEIDFNRAIEIGKRFESLAKRLFSLEPHIKRLFASADTTVTWRLSTTTNIVEAIETEVRLYVDYFLPFVSTDFIEDLSPEDKDTLLILRAQIRLRKAKDGNAENAGSKPTLTPDAGDKVPRVIRWSDFRQPREWRRLRRLKGLSHSVNTWPKLYRDNPDDIECESIKSARISFELAQSWGLDLPEFQT
jgi:hypothetical protein